MEVAVAICFMILAVLAMTMEVAASVVLAVGYDHHNEFGFGCGRGCYRPWLWPVLVVLVLSDCCVFS